MISFNFSNPEKYMCPYHFTNKKVKDDSKVRDWSGWAGYSFSEQLLEKQALRD